MKVTQRKAGVGSVGLKLKTTTPFVCVNFMVSSLWSTTWRCGSVAVGIDLPPSVVSFRMTSGSRGLTGFRLKVKQYVNPSGGLLRDCRSRLASFQLDVFFLKPPGSVATANATRPPLLCAPAARSGKFQGPWGQFPWVQARLRFREHHGYKQSLKLIKDPELQRAGCRACLVKGVVNLCCAKLQES